MVSSVTSLGELQRVLINLGESKPTIRLIFLNKEIKRFYLPEEDNERLFFLKLKKECIKHGHDFIYWISFFIFKIKIKTNKKYQFVLKIILLIGINTSLIKYPTAPITANPIAHDEAILIYSLMFRIKLNTFSVWLCASVQESITLLGEWFNFLHYSIDSI